MLCAITWERNKQLKKAWSKKKDFEWRIMKEDEDEEEESKEDSMNGQSRNA